MATLKYVYANLAFKPLMIFCVTCIFYEGYAWLKGYEKQTYNYLFLHLVLIFGFQSSHFYKLRKGSEEVIEQVLVTNMIKKRSFKYIKGSYKGEKVWQEIIADINIQVKARVNNKNYEMDHIDAVKDRFFGIMNNFFRACKKNKKSINDFTNWEKTLLMARNMYDEDVASEKALD